MAQSHFVTDRSYPLHWVTSLPSDSGFISMLTNGGGKLKSEHTVSVRPSLSSLTSCILCCTNLASEGPGPANALRGLLFSLLGLHSVSFHGRKTLFPGG